MKPNPKEYVDITLTREQWREVYEALHQHRVKKIWNGLDYKATESILGEIARELSYGLEDLL